MILTLGDYVNRQMDPAAPFEPVSVSDELMNAMLTNPAATIPASFGPDIVRAQVDNALRLQQHLVYRVGAKLGFLSSIAPQVRGALQIVPPMLVDAFADLDAMVAEAIGTGIGTAVDAIGSVPIIGWIIKIATIGLQIGMARVLGLDLPGERIGPELLEAAAYSTEADASLANTRLTSQAETADWTTLFMPAMRGQLAGRILEDAVGRVVIAWGFADDGKVPRVIIDKKPISTKPKPYLWHFSEGNGGPFTDTDGLGIVPGTARMVTVIQSALVERTMIKIGHETLGDPRCGSARKTIDTDIGTFFPSTANGAWTLFGACTKAGAPAYALATQEILNAWQAYADELWEGVERLWRNESWEGGWGCGPWQNALQGLVRAHCVGSDGQIGTFGAWAPPQGGDYDRKLNVSDRNAWEKNNLVTKIINPAMKDLREMQLALLRSTPMAAYLPATGLGSMRDVSVKDAFEKARLAIMRKGGGGRGLNRDLNRRDVVDDWYREQLTQAGIGSDTASGGISSSDYKPPRTAVSIAGGGAGRAGILIGGGLLGLAALGIAIARRRRR